MRGRDRERVSCLQHPREITSLLSQIKSIVPKEQGHGALDHSLLLGEDYSPKIPHLESIECASLPTGGILPRITVASLYLRALIRAEA